MMRRQRKSIVGPKFDGQGGYWTGVPLASTRPLDSMELRRLRAEMHTLMKRELFLVLLLPFLFLGLMAFVLVFEKNDNLLMIPILIGTAGIAAVCLISRDLGSMRRALKRDLKGGIIHIYRAPAEPELFLIPQMLLVQLQALGERGLEVLPCSGLIWVDNRIVVQAPAWGDAFAVNPDAPLPEVPKIAQIAAEWVRPDGESGTLSNHRPLSASEIAELRQFRKSLMMPWLPMAIICTVNSGLFIAISTETLRPLTLMNVILALIAGFYAVRNALLSRRITRDIEIAAALVVRFRSSGEVGSQLSPTQEFLPTSRVLWTYDGKPAHWRV